MTRRWKAVKQARFGAAAQARVRSRVEAELETMSLRALRQELALTQVELGRSAEMTQSELSRIESRADHLTSTLRRYVEALGGELEITAIVRGRRVKLSDA
jgi:predicted transcriptional regulator